MEIISLIEFVNIIPGTKPIRIAILAALTLLIKGVYRLKRPIIILPTKLEAKLVKELFTLASFRAVLTTAVARLARSTPTELTKSPPNKKLKPMPAKIIPKNDLSLSPICDCSGEAMNMGTYVPRLEHDKLIFELKDTVDEEEIIIDIDRTNEWGSIDGSSEELNGNYFWEAIE